MTKQQRQRAARVVAKARADALRDAIAVLYALPRGR